MKKRSSVERNMHNINPFPKVNKMVGSVLVGTGALLLLSGQANTEGNLLNPTPVKVNAAEIEASVQANLVNNAAFDAEGSWMYKRSERLVVEGNGFGYIPSGTNDAFVLQYISTEPGKEYTLEADILLEGAEVPAGALLTVKQTDASGAEHGPVQSEILLTGTPQQWKRESITFVATSEHSLIGLVKWADASNTDAFNTSIKIDNVTLTTEEAVVEEVYDLVWKDEFNQAVLDQDKWGYELGNIRGNEQQHYSSSKENVYLEDDNLVLQITDRPEADQYRNTEKLGENARLVKYNSGSVRTHGKQEFLYGKIEARMKLPKGKGAFPAFWTLGADFPLDGRINSDHGYGWPATGEIDIMEMIGAPTEERILAGELKNPGTSNKTTFGTAHWYWEDSTDGDKDGSYAPTSVAGSKSLPVDFYDEYHVFGINWSPDKIEWTVDDEVFNVMHFDDTPRMQAAAKAINRPQYIQLNLAAGGNWPGSAGDYLGVDGTKVQIDWVQWSQTDEQQAAMEAYYADSPVINGASDVTMVEGTLVDLLQNVTANREDYYVDYSIENEYMFINAGAEGGRNEVVPIVKSEAEAEKLQELTAGIYNLHYTALPLAEDFTAGGAADWKLARTSVVLTVLPKDISGNVSEPVSTIALPEGWTWIDGSQLLEKGASYDVLFTNSLDSLTTEENRRSQIVTIPAQYLIADQEEPETPEEKEKQNNRDKTKNGNNKDTIGNNKNKDKNGNHGNN